MTHTKTHRKTHRSAMTLIEVMIVLTIIVIVAGITFPLMQGTIATQRLRRAADTVRAEWLSLRLQAIGEGRIVAFRAAIGSDQILIDRVLDSHTTATLSMTPISDETGRERRDTLTAEEFTGTADDFILRTPDAGRDDPRLRRITLPSTIFTADVITIADDRAAFVLGANTERNDDMENQFQYEAITQDDTRLGEEIGSDGTLWSAPILFYPDGSTSTAALLLKGESGRCLELRLRGLTGATTISSLITAEEYIGDLNATTTKTQQ